MKKRYKNLDGLRAYACIGIVLMHVLANGGFGLKGFVFEKIIPSFTNFTYLFMLLSAFSMCCGYYEKFKNNSINLEAFYKRRYQRIWPFFALLCTIELIVNHSITSLYDWFADLTLVFGLIPNNGIEVVGVGWFLGTIFVFYMVFPFFVFLLNNEKRAWFVMVIALILHLLCTIRFTETGGRENIVYSSIFFIAGGLLFLYRDRLVKIQFFSIAATLIAIAFYYHVDSSDYSNLILFSLLTIVCITCGGGITKTIFQNKMVRLLSSISMEVYLCHMFVYRVIERHNLLQITGNKVANYFIVSIVTICGASIFAILLKKIIVIVNEESIWSWANENLNG